MRLEILTVVSLTCVGRWGACTQSKDVIFQFDKDVFLFSLGEERNEEGWLSHGNSAMLRTRMTIDKFRTSWELQLLLWVFLRWTCWSSRGHTQSHLSKGCCYFILFCLGGPIFSLFALNVLLLISSAVLNLIPIMGATKNWLLLFPLNCLCGQ